METGSADPLGLDEPAELAGPSFGCSLPTHTTAPTRVDSNTKGRWALAWAASLGAGVAEAEEPGTE